VSGAPAGLRAPRPVNGIHAAVLGLAALALAACAGADADARARWTTTVDTLPDGRVHVVNTPPASGIRPTWVIEPELMIGSVDETGPTSFGEVKGIVVTDDGRIAVLDAQAQEIRVFAPDGAHLRTFGRRGAGPGEMENANGMALGPDGLIRVNDPRNARMSFFHPDSGFIRSHRIQVSSFAWMWDGVVDAAGKVWERQFTMLGDAYWRVLRAYDAHGEWTDTIRLEPLEPGEDGPGVYRWRTPDGGGGLMGVPFWPAGASDYDPRGFFWDKPDDSNDYRILHYRPGGDTTLVFESHRPAVPVSAAERDSVIAGIQRRIPSADFDWSRIPAEKPIVQSLFVDESGRVWVRVTTPDTLLTYDVYLPDGTYDGTAVTSLKIPASWQPLVRGDLFYTLITDELDVPYVVRARIRLLEE
jgi:hypothetical protein